MFLADILGALKFVQWRLVLILLETVRQKDLVADAKTQHAIFPDRELNDPALPVERFVQSRHTFRPFCLKELKRAYQLVGRATVPRFEFIEELLRRISATRPPGEPDLVQRPPNTGLID